MKGTDALKTTLGTPDYMAPEIYGGGKYGEKVDLWALGCIVYFMLNGSLWTHGMQTDQIRELVTSSEVIELQDNKVKSFTEASKSFVRSLLIKDPSKRMDFDALEKHPFLSPSVHFTLALNSRPGYPPYLCSGSFDLSSLTTRPLTWGSIANYTYDRVKSWGLVPKDQKMAVVVDNNIVDPGKEFSPKAGLTGTVNIYIFFQHSQPACINKASLTTYSDVTAQEVDNAIGFATGGQAVLNEAFFYKKKIEEMHGYFASFSGMRAEALRFVGELDGVCQSYVDNFLNKLAIEAEAALRRFGVQATLSTIVTGGTEDILKKEGAQDISFMEGLRTDMTIINGILNKTIRCDPSDVKIRSAFYRFRNTHLHAFAEAIRREFDSYINSWNKIAYLILCIPLILKLKGIANTIITDKTREAAAASANSYVTTFTLLICNNPTWKSVPVAELNRSRSASELSTALMTIQDLQAKLEGAYAKIKRLEDENNALQAALKNAEESARLHTPKI